MANRSVDTFRFFCGICGVISTAKCRKCGAVEHLDPIADPDQKWVVKEIYFTERQWETLATLAKVIPGVASPLEFLRLAISSFLTSPPRRLLRLAMPKGTSALNAQASFAGLRRTRRRENAPRNA